MVLEMGMNHFREISLLSNIAKPNICIITNIGTSHIGNLGSRENILKAKLEILEGADNPTIIINNDNDLLHRWHEENRGKTNLITFGIYQSSNVNANEIVLKEDSSEFICHIDKDDIKIKVPVGGEHFILNSLCAVSVGKSLKIQTDKIIKGIEEFQLTKKRMDITELKNGIKIINDAYNASLESMQASLKYLGKFKENRKIAVLGDMLELGEYSQMLHEQVGEEVYKNRIDLLMCSGEKAESIVKKAKEVGMQEKDIYYYKNKEEIEKKLKEMVKPGDIILFKASNGMRFFDIAENMKENF